MKRFSSAQKFLFLASVAVPVLAVPVGALAQQAAMAPVNATTVKPPVESMATRVAEHIAHLRAELQITPAEAPQWHQFAQVMRGDANQMEVAFKARAMNMGTMNAVQDMQSYAHLAQIHANNMQQLSAAFQTLYNSFPPAQQKLADSIFRENASMKMKKH